MHYYDEVIGPDIFSPTSTRTQVTQDQSVQIGYDSTDEPRFAQTNGNLFFTSDDGILKLSSPTDTLYQAGSPPGLDLFGNYNVGTASSWWDISSADPTGKTVGYRVLFGYTDPNDNLILGAPSGIFTISNPVVDGSGSAGPAISGYDITVTSVAHGLTTGMNMMFIDADGWTDDDAVEGTYEIVVLTDDTFKYNVTNDPGPTGTLKYAYAMQTRLSFTVPSQVSTDINTGWFYRLYRSDQQLISVGVQSDFKLIDEKFLTSTELGSLVVVYNDNNPESFKGELLYTNQNSGEGELQANYRPPQAKDITLYQDHMFYANCVSRHALEFAMIQPSVFVDGFSYLEVTVGSVNRRYVAQAGIGNREVDVGLSDSGGDLLFQYINHGLPSTGPATIFVSETNGTLAIKEWYVIYVDADTFKIAATIADWQASNAVTYLDAGSPTEGAFEVSRMPYGLVSGATWSREDGVITVTEVGHGLTPNLTIYVDNSAGGTPEVPSDTYLVTVVPDANTFQIVDNLANSTAGGQTLDYNLITGVFYADSSVGTDAEQIRDSANYLVRAINRDDVSVVYADYTSTPIDNPGNMRLRAKDFGDPIYLYVSDSTTQEGFFPTIPVFTTSPDQIFSANPSQINTLYFSKLQEPEAVPLVNFVPVGSSNAAILSIHALTNSIVVLKEDGVFRLTGDNPANFVVSLLDNTIISVAKYSSVLFANQIAALTNQGICLISETSVQIISRNIENLIQTSLDDENIGEITVGFSYELERLYRLTTINSNAERVTYNFNILTNTWSTSDHHMTSATIGPDDRMYHVGPDLATIYRERRDDLRTDYTGSSYSIDLITVSSSTAIVVELDTYQPSYGDVIYRKNQLNIVKEVSAQGFNRFQLTFFSDHNLSVGDELFIYEAYESRMQLAPYTAGQVGLQKQFTQMQVHFRNRSTTALEVSFTSDTYESGQVNSWQSPAVGAQWGLFRWGALPWGSATTNSLDFVTTPAPICRLYVSRGAQRSTYLQPKLVNNVGGDRLDIQSVNIASRTYGERVSR